MGSSGIYCISWLFITWRGALSYTTATLQRFTPRYGKSTTNNMLIGEYRHTIDTKNRISLPAKFRKDMGKVIYVTRGLDNCLSVYTEKSWKQILGKLQNLSISKESERGFNRFILSGATEVEIDSMGRILVPEYLKEFAKLEKKVVWTGAGDRAEMWDEDTWNKYLQEKQKNPEAMAESLEGII